MSGPIWREHRAGELRILAVDEALDELRQLAVLADEPLHAIVEAAAFRIEVLLERVAQPAVDAIACADRASAACRLTSRSLSRWMRSALDLAADVPQGQDADLQRFERILIALVAFGVFGEGADHFAVVDHQLQRQRIGQLAVLNRRRRRSR